MFNRLLSLSRKVIVSAVVVVLLALVPLVSVFAQGESFGLGQTDYLLLTTANTLTRFAASYGYDFQLNMTVSGVPDTSGTMDVTGTGEIIYGASPTLRLDLQGNVALEGQANIPFSLESRVIDGVLYMNTVNPDGTRTGWGGITVEEAATALLQGLIDSNKLPIDSELLSEPLNATSLIQMGEMLGMGQARDLFSGIPPADYLSITRGPDETVDGQAQAVFVIDVDLAQILTSEGIINYLMSLEGGDAPLRPHEVETAGDLLRTVFADTHFTVNQYIGLDDGLVHRILVTLNLAVDVAEIDGSRTPPMNALMTLDVTLRGFNQSYSITPPPNADLSDDAQDIVNSLPVLALPTPTLVAPVLSATPAPLGQATVSPTPSGLQAGTPTPAPGLPTTLVLQLNTPLIVQISGRDPINLTYAATGSQAIVVTARSLQVGAVDTTLEVLDAAGNRLGFNDDHGAAVGTLNVRDSSITNLLLPAAGTYTIRVNSFTGVERGEVEVVVQDASTIIQPTLVPTIDSGGGKPGTIIPSPIPPTTVPPVQTGSGINQIVQGSLSPNQLYTYSFNAAAGDIVTITVRDTSGTLDPIVTLLFNNGILAVNDDHSSGDFSLDIFDSQIANFTLNQAGSYTIQIGDYFNSAGSFELTIAPGVAIVK